MKRGFRLRRPTDFKRVRRHGKSAAHPLVVVFTLSNEGYGVRVGIAAGKSIGGAVQRNRAKRILRAAVAPLLESIKPDHDILLMARPALREASSTDLQPILQSLLGKAGLIS